MDNRQALVLRNRAMAEAFHKTPYKYLVRRAFLRMIVRFPFAPMPKPNVERILLIRPDHLGDMLLTTPAIHALRNACPRAEIHMLAGPWSANVLANYPEIDAVLTLPFPGFSRSPKENLRSPYQLALTASRSLRRVGYDSAVILRPDHWWGGLLAHLAGIERIIGYDLPDVELFLTDKIPYTLQHAVLQNLELVEYWTGKVPRSSIVYQFPISEVDQHYINGYLEEWGMEPQAPLICIHPGSGTWVKHWEEAKWASVADTLAEQLNVNIVFTGGDHETALIQRIADRMKHRACLMAGDTQVGQLAALFARAKVVLGPDSGPLHLAVAAGAPTVTLFGPANPLEFGPWGPADKNIVLTSDIGCRPCGVLDWGADDPANHPCVREITVGRVLEASRRATQFNQE